MPVKEILEKIAFAVARIEKLKAVLLWFLSSSLRRLLAVLLICCIPLGMVLYLHVMQKGSWEQTKVRLNDVEYLVKENGYKVALDALTLCIESRKDKLPLSKWYCEDATLKFRQHSLHWPAERVEELIQKSAYEAMRNDVSHYIRSIPVDRAIHAPDTKEEQFLKFVFDNTMFGIWVTLVVTLLMGSTYLLLWHLPRKLHPPSSLPSLHFEK